MVAIIQGKNTEQAKYAGQVVYIWNRQNGSQSTHEKIHVDFAAVDDVVIGWWSINYL